MQAHLTEYELRRRAPMIGEQLMADVNKSLDQRHEAADAWRSQAVADVAARPRRPRRGPRDNAHHTRRTSPRVMTQGRPPAPAVPGDARPCPCWPRLDCFADDRRSPPPNRSSSLFFAGTVPRRHRAAAGGRGGPAGMSSETRLFRAGDQDVRCGHFARLPRGFSADAFADTAKTPGGESRSPWRRRGARRTLGADSLVGNIVDFAAYADARCPLSPMETRARHRRRHKAS